MEVIAESKESYPKEGSQGMQITVRSAPGELTVDTYEKGAMLVKVADIQFIGEGSRGGIRKTYERRASVLLTAEELLAIVNKAIEAGLISLKAQISV